MSLIPFEIWLVLQSAFSGGGDRNRLQLLGVEIGSEEVRKAGLFTIFFLSSFLLLLLLINLHALTVIDYLSIGRNVQAEKLGMFDGCSLFFWSGLWASSFECILGSIIPQFQ